MTIKITWFSHSAFQLDIDGIIVLVDPFITGNPLATISADELDADYILLTHAHGDHLGDTVPIAERTNAQVIGMAEVAYWMEAHGIENTHAQNTGGSYRHPFGEVKFVKAEHSSSFPDGTYGGQACGIVLTTDDKRLYFAGDTALFSDMKLVGELEIDLACLPIGDNFTMGPSDAVTATKWIHPKAVFPIHYNTFPVIVQDAAGWARRVNNETSAQAIVVDPGSGFSI
jgi:L-ascorbate metabolism protein UlaG (beta-lactamase superfamily)